MIPIVVETYLAKDTGDIFRYDPQRAMSILRQLGVPASSEFGEFYHKYQGGFISPRPVAELLDIDGPATPAIPDQTEYVRDRYQLPEKFLALTSDESEGMYLYNTDDQAVYDFDLGQYQDFLAGKVSARWKTFNEFLIWYFSNATD
ncbi:MAG: hypothetical protein RL748_1740 [Pseudomonadota bacterium]|jgi:hypothetical protein